VALKHNPMQAARNTSADNDPRSSAFIDAKFVAMEGILLASSPTI
jgi:hypothetical protein